MKKLIAVGLAIWAGAASAEMLYVQAAKGHQCVGDRFQINAPMEVLYQDRKCDLPLVHAKDMRAYLFRAKDTVMRGCWGKTLDGTYVIVDQNGTVSNSASNAYVTAKTVSGSEAVVTVSPNQGTAYAKAMEMCP